MAIRVWIAEMGDGFDAPQHENLLEILKRGGYPIATSCGGVTACGLCRVTIQRGMNVLSLIRALELHHLGNVAKVIGLRLACQARVCADGDLLVSVPAVEDVAQRKRRKAERVRAQRAAGSLAAAAAPRRCRRPGRRGSRAHRRTSSNGAQG